MTQHQILFVSLSLVVGYLFGSIPFALIIGKVFYNVDIRKHGSFNLGGTNAGRVLGRKAGLAVMVLDVAKNFFGFLIVRYLLSMAFNITDLNFLSLVCFLTLTMGVIGHCYPLFASFKGGKAVSASVSYIIATNFILVILFFTLFLSILKLFKMVSLSSMVSMSLVTIAAMFMAFVPWSFWFGLQYNFYYPLCLGIITLLLIYRHRSNIVRIISKKENKIKWMK